VTERPPETSPETPPETPPRPSAPLGGAVGPETVERFGRPLRHFPVAVSAEAMAQAWANREDGPHGATVTVEHEVGPRGFHGAIWRVPPADSLVCAVVLRPRLAAEEGDVSWLVAGLSALEGAEAVSSRSIATWWPAGVVEGPERAEVAAVKAEVQLGPGRVKNVVVTMRFRLSGLGLGADQRDALLESVLGAVDRNVARLDEGPAAVAAAYEGRCGLLGQRVKVKLRPKGETRGTARGIDRTARLELASASGMVERVGIDQMIDLTVV
jgi:biotin-(acetyl-CoA carboxylase) ligase